MEITRPTVEHAASIIEIRGISRAETYADDTNGTTKEFYLERNGVNPANLQKEEADLQDPLKAYWIAVNGDVLAGFVRVIKGERQSLDMIHILPKYQGQGLGNRLMSLALLDLDRQRPIFLEVVHGNDKARDWYVRHGWLMTGQVHDGTPLPDGSGYVPEHIMVLEPEKR